MVVAREAARVVAMEAEAMVVVRAAVGAVEAMEEGTGAARR